MVRRVELLQAWASEQIKATKGDAVEITELEAISGDASFRHYYRLSVDKTSLIAVDAPPETEDNPAFVAIAGALLQAGIHAPIVHAYDMEHGFLLLSDLGDQQLLGCLCSDNVEAYYQKALDTLVLMQQIPCRSFNRSEDNGFYSCPDYDLQRLQDEMKLFNDWFLPQYLDLHLNQNQHEILNKAFDLFAQSALEQPRVFVHRDYHSRNIMLLDNDDLAIIDFQDGVMGPICYDLVSLLKDCYISWPGEQVEKWVIGYGNTALQAGLLDKSASGALNKMQLLKWFDWMGVQRHLKAIGIFARLKIRDQKPAYLKDIPRTFNYILEVSCRYAELEPLHQLLQTAVLPRLLKVNPDAEAFIDRQFLL